MEKKQINKRRLSGTVVSDKMQKTVTVKVERTVMHPKYHKRFVRSVKLKAHDANGEYHVGDAVVIEECRPLSADKRWRVIGKAVTA